MNKLNIGEKVMLLTAPCDEGALGLYDPVLDLDGMKILHGTIMVHREDEGEEQDIYEVEILDGTNTYYSDYARKFILTASDLGRLQTTFDRLMKEIA